MKCRSIAYTYDFKSWIRRYIGKDITITSPEGQAEVVHISSIIERSIQRTDKKSYDIYLSNGNEQVKWRTVTCDNVEVEYFAEELLCDQ